MSCQTAIPALLREGRTKIEFPDYSADELFDIFEYMAQDYTFTLVKGTAMLHTDVINIPHPK